MSEIFNPKDKIIFDQMVTITTFLEANNTSTLIAPNLISFPDSVTPKKKYRLIVVEEAGDSYDK